MKRRKLFLITGLLLLFTGCGEFFMICSLNPFYQERNITLIPGIEGNWSVSVVKAKSDTTQNDHSTVWKQVDTTSVWSIRQFILEQKIKTKNGTDSTVFSPQNYYHVKLFTNRSDSSLYTFKVVLFKVKNNLYADILPIEIAGLNRSKLAGDTHLVVHTLAKIMLTDGNLSLSWLGSDCMKEMIENKRVRVSYRWVKESKRLLLTGTSNELTGLIERYAGEPRFIDWNNQKAMLKLNQINK
jgi:hypothetical protein